MLRGFASGKLGFFGRSKGQVQSAEGQVAAGIGSGIGDRLCGPGGRLRYDRELSKAGTGNLQLLWLRGESGS